jgi:hypothetical protein
VSLSLSLCVRLVLLLFCVLCVCGRLLWVSTSLVLWQYIDVREHVGFVFVVLAHVCSNALATLGAERVRSGAYFIDAFDSTPAIPHTYHTHTHTLSLSLVSLSVA